MESAILKDRLANATQSYCSWCARSEAAATEIAELAAEGKATKKQAAQIKAAIAGLKAYEYAKWEAKAALKELQEAIDKLEGAAK